MCGIAGFLSFSRPHQEPRGALIDRAAAMAQSMVPRGPDDQGVWVDPAAGLGLAFRRLAIVDLSPAGHQPMESASGRLVIVFNGEIYNHRRLRDMLPDAATMNFRGHSDTEVLLAAIETWGLEETLRRAVGMFALAVWDRHQNALSLARDRMGEKPLYYGLANETLLFGSELKALAAHPAFENQIDPDALSLYLQYGYVPAPRSIYRSISKLNPGSFLTLRSPQGVQRYDCLPEPTAYWSVHAAAALGQRDPFQGSFEDATARLDELLRGAIADQMVADVPVGAFLSGGIDSSTVVALMQAQSNRRVKTFSIGFHEAGYDEAPHARAVAEHLGTDHTELYVTPEEAQAVIPRLPLIYDEPFADSSQVPTFLVSQLARRQVTVSLSGDGGDELFCGYSRYMLTQRLWRTVRRFPLALRWPLAHALLHVPSGALDRALFWLRPWANRHGAPARVSDKLRRVAELLKRRNVEDFYRAIVSIPGPPGQSLCRAPEPVSVLSDPATWPRLSDARERMMYLDQMSYLPDDILTKVDRATMGVSLESRVPLLDHRLVEFAWQLPLEYKVRAGRSKAVLRAVLAKYVPPALTERPKMGFGIPIGAWLRGPLRAWGEALLDTRVIAQQDLLNSSAVQTIWREHQGGQRDWSSRLWSILMFQAWQAECVNAQSTSRRAA